MAKASAMEAVRLDFLNNWNSEFPEFQLSDEDLLKPQLLMGALFQFFDRIGIDKDAVLMPPTEKNLNEHMKYYFDLIPVINMTRVINHLISVMPQGTTVRINHFLSPSKQTSYSILLFVLNLMVFNEHRLQSIAPLEEELFNFSEMIKELEEQKNNLFEMLNRQAEEKGKRAGRMEQMQQEIQQLEEEIQQEEQACAQDKQELEAETKETNNTDVLLDQKRATKEGLLAERDRKKALRVCDVEDIRTKVAQAAQNVKEAEEKLNSMKTVIAQKENSLKILHVIKPNLDTATNLLDEITKLKDSDEMSDLDEESKEGELAMLNTDVLELQGQARELAALRADHLHKRAEAQARRHQERTLAESALREAEEQDKKRREFISKATQRTHEIKQQTIKYAEEKTFNSDTIEKIKEDYNNAVKEWEEALTKLLTDLKLDLEKKTAEILESE